MREANYDFQLQSTTKKYDTNVTTRQPSDVCEKYLTVLEEIAVITGVIVLENWQ